MKMKNILGSFGSLLLAIAFLLIIGLIIAILINGLVWFTESVYGYLILIASGLFWLGLVIFLPLAFFKKTRLLSGFAFLIAAYYYGTVLWFTGLITAYTIWGTAAVVIGIFFAAIGIIPIAMIASAFTGSWADLWNLLFWIAIVIAHGGLGMWLLAKADKETS
jgi:hypothetical protein